MAEQDPNFFQALLRGLRRGVGETADHMVSGVVDPVTRLRELEQLRQSATSDPIGFGKQAGVALRDQFKTAFSDPEEFGAFASQMLMPGPSVGKGPMREIIAGPKGIKQMTENAGGVRKVENATGEGLHGYEVEEIPDFKARLKDTSRLEHSFENVLQPAKLPDILDHPKLFEAYPDLANTRVLPSGDSGASFTPGLWNAIRIGRVDDPLRNILHEVQHNVQHLEGYQNPYRGTTGAGGFEKYWTNPGEVEARVVEDRMDFHPDQLKQLDLSKHLKSNLKDAYDFKPEPQNAFEVIERVRNFNDMDFDMGELDDIYQPTSSQSIPRDIIDALRGKESGTIGDMGPADPSRRKFLQNAGSLAVQAAAPNIPGAKVLGELGKLTSPQAMAAEAAKDLAAPVAKALSPDLKTLAARLYWRNIHPNVVLREMGLVDETGPKAALWEAIEDSPEDALEILKREGVDTSGLDDKLADLFDDYADMDDGPGSAAWSMDDADNLLEDTYQADVDRFEKLFGEEFPELSNLDREMLRATESGVGLFNEGISDLSRGLLTSPENIFGAAQALRGSNLSSLIDDALAGKMPQELHQALGGVPGLEWGGFTAPEITDFYTGKTPNPFESSMAQHGGFANSLVDALRKPALDETQDIPRLPTPPNLEATQELFLGEGKNLEQILASRAIQDIPAMEMGDTESKILQKVLREDELLPRRLEKNLASVQEQMGAEGPQSIEDFIDFSTGSIPSGYVPPSADDLRWALDQGYVPNAKDIELINSIDPTILGRKP